ncbi:MAG: Rrf2 family transcriptional regulator [Ilumatobacteraceae bacterium]
MRINQGVEWAIHACVNLVWIDGGPASSARLAEFHELPPAYLNKQLQALSRAGVLKSVPGQHGGFALARAPEAISTLDVMQAIEGDEPAFRCAEIRQRGPLPASKASCRTPCQINSIMLGAEAAWRAELDRHTIAEIAADVSATAPAVPERVRRWFLRGADRS